VESYSTLLLIVVVLFGQKFNAGKPIH